MKACILADRGVVLPQLSADSAYLSSPLAMSALRVSRDGGEVVHPLNSGSQHPEMEQIGTSARYSVRKVTTISE